MNTYEATLLSGAWTELLGGQNTLSIDVKSQTSIAICFTETDTAPAIDAPFVRVQSYPHGGAYYASGLPNGQYVWGRAISGSVEIVVIR
jgi:hypothetical protein